MQEARCITRLQRELKMLQTDPPPGVCAWASNDSMFELEAQVQGPVGTVYASGIFKLEIQIPERYPFEPPHVRFTTPVYHPNIDTGGRICLDILNMPPKGAWRPSLNIPTVLASIGLLLAEPNPDDGLMGDISAEYKHNRPSFDVKARKWTSEYAVEKQYDYAAAARPVPTDRQILEDSHKQPSIMIVPEANSGGTDLVPLKTNQIHAARVATSDAGDQDIRNCGVKETSSCVPVRQKLNLSMRSSKERPQGLNRVIKPRSELDTSATKTVEATAGHELLTRIVPTQSTAYCTSVSSLPLKLEGSKEGNNILLRGSKSLKLSRQKGTPGPSASLAMQASVDKLSDAKIAQLIDRADPIIVLDSESEDDVVEQRHKLSLVKRTGAKRRIT